MKKKNSRQNTVVATINTGIGPTGITITPDNHFAYVANFNGYGLPGKDSVSVLNLKKNTVETTIYDSSFHQPYRVAINASGTKAYVPNSNSTVVSIIDMATNTVTGTIDGFDGPSGMVITPSGTHAYVNNYGGIELSGEGSTVRVVDLRKNAIVGPPIKVGRLPASLAISPDGAFVYSVNYIDGNPGTGTISVIRTRTNTVVNTITGFSGPFYIAITPNGRYAYVTNFGSNNYVPIGQTVSVVDLHCNAIVATIDVGIQPAGIAITPDGAFVYVTNYNALYNGNVLVPGQGTVNIIDTRTNKVIPPTIAVAQGADIVAISPNGKHAYVTNYFSNVVSVIALP